MFDTFNHNAEHNSQKLQNIHFSDAQTSYFTETWTWLFLLKVDRPTVRPSQVRNFGPSITDSYRLNYASGYFSNTFVE